MKTYVYQHEDKVRDYECDLQGVVNNANYLHYMEHTRHEFLLSLGENFSDLHDRGMDLFVARIEIQLKHSLQSGDRYLSCLNASKEGVKLVMSQDIYKLPEKELVSRGTVDCVLVDNGKLSRGEYFDELLKRIKNRATIENE
mgnify:FL=1